MSKETVVNLKKALQDTLERNHVKEEEKERRLAICDTCEHKRRSRCNLCGCFITYKAGLTNSECPLGKWSTFLPETSVDSASEQQASE
mgnify:CR=1 FL=1